MSTQNTQNLSTEEIATSNKRNELAARRQAKCATTQQQREARKQQKGERLQLRLSYMTPEQRQKYDDKKAKREAFNALSLEERKAIRLEKKLANQKAKAERIANMSPEKRAAYDQRLAEREAFKSLTKEEKANIREQKKQEREARKIASQKAKEARIANMSPQKRENYEKKKAEREVFKSLPYEEQLKIKQQRRLEREANKLAREQKKQDRLDNMLPQKREALLERKRVRQAEKDAFKALPREEQLAIKEQQKEERLHRREQWKYLSENWCEEIPDDLDLIIADGNNIRGGGPKRMSRDDVIEILDKYHKISPNTEIICLFDHEPSRYQSIPKIEVQFSGDEIADDIIVQIAEKNTERSYIVITCDRGLGVRILELGGKVMRNKKFISYTE
jgi:hypothetical protein